MTTETLNLAPLPDLEEVIKNVRKIAAGNPNFVYSAPEPHAECVYVHEGKSSCLIGQAFELAGTPIEDLAEWDQANSSYSPSIGDVLTHIYGLKDDNPVVSWLSNVQVQQDSMSPWADAVEYADAESR